MTKPFALIIDDDIPIAKFFAFVLQSAGFETEMVHDGRRALDRLAEITPHLIVLDMYLPDMFGGEILRQIRQDERLSKVWVIVATAVGRSLDAWIEENADFVLTKPIGHDQIYQVALRLRDQDRKSSKKIEV